MLHNKLIKKYIHSRVIMQYACRLLAIFKSILFSFLMFQDNKIRQSKIIQNLINCSFLITRLTNKNLFMK